MNKHFREQAYDKRHKSSDNENLNNVMTEKVQILANKIYKEFERLISFYGSDVVEYLMPLIVNVLENLEELYRDKHTYEIEVELLKEDNCTLNRQYEREKHLKKQSEERIIHVEYAYEEEKKALEEKIIILESSNRTFEVKFRNSSETILRLEEKIEYLKSENQKIYDRYTEVLKSHAEQLNKIKAETYRDISPPQSLQIRDLENRSSKSLIRDLRLKTNYQNSVIITNKFLEAEYPNPDLNHLHNGNFDSFDEKYNKPESPDCISHHGETVAEILSNDQWMIDCCDGETDCNHDHSNDLKNPSQFDSSSSYFIDPQDVSQRMNQDHSIEANIVDSDTDVTDDEFGIGREIDSIIRENQDLVATKNALNIVKDDLINRLDVMTSENDMLREEIRRHSNREADLKGKLVHLEQELKTYKEKLIESEASEDSSSNEQKTFSRSEMAILLEEKNHYKEKLLELQDAVVYKEMCRVKKQFPEFKDSSKSVKSNNSGIWNLFGFVKILFKCLLATISNSFVFLSSFRRGPKPVCCGDNYDKNKKLKKKRRRRLISHKKFNHLFKKEDEIAMQMKEKSKSLLSRFKRESDRSQLYSWSVPRSLVESELPKRIPIPIKIQTIFEPKDLVICATTGYGSTAGNDSAQYLWCLIQSNTKNNKNFYLQQMCLTEKVPELTNKYSINLQFVTTPFTMTEVPAINLATKHFSLLISGNENKSMLKINDRKQTGNQSDIDEIDKKRKIFQTKLQMKSKIKHNLGSKTIWFACEKNHIVIYVLFDNNKIESRMSIVTMDSEIDFIRYNFGRVFVIGKNGSLGIFELNKEMNHWELNQCLLIDMTGGLPISDLCCDANSLRLWIGSSTSCCIMDLSTLDTLKRLQVMEDSHLSDFCSSIESMIIIEKYSLMLISISRLGMLLGYDLKSFQYKVSLDLKPSVFELIEPIQGIEKSTLSLFHLIVDDERIWMTTDCGMIIVVTLDTLACHLRNHSVKTTKLKLSLQTDKVYISSHAFAQCIKIISLLEYYNTSLCLKNANSLKRFTGKNEINSTQGEKSKDELEKDLSITVKTHYMMTAIGSSYVNLNCTGTDVMHPSNHAIIWKS